MEKDESVQDKTIQMAKDLLSFKTDIKLPVANSVETAVNRIKMAVEVVMGLTPEQYDALYSDEFNNNAHIDNAIRLIGNDRKVISKYHKTTAFDYKRIIFAVIWPEYYAEHFSEIKPWQIFNAEGDVLNGLTRAGKPKFSKKQED